MSLRVLLGSILILLASAASAENLRPIELRLPADEAAVRGQCEAAFDQALKDKEEYERRPEINLMCALNLNGDQMAVLRAGMVESCMRTFAVRSRGQAPGAVVVVDTKALMVAFDGDYAAIFRTICLDRAVSSFHVTQAQRAQGERASTTPSNGSCSGVGCQAPIAGANR